MSQKYEKQKTKLQELFQLDQPDLDFGLYRVMHAKSAEVSHFLDKDLLPQVHAAFGQYRTADKVELEKELDKVIEQARGLGVDPETTQKVRDLRARLVNDAVDMGALESAVYDHLFSFVRRYYSDGDFLAKRVYKPGVYAIPYEGEEVTLHWANKDQYYIKTSEYLRDYAFRLRPDDDKKPMRVHFRLAEAAEGEHGNVKAAEGKDRVFILAAPGESGRDCITEESGEQGKELVIVEHKHSGAKRAAHGEAVLVDLSRRLTADVGKGFTATNLRHMRAFYVAFPIQHALRDESPGLRPELSWTQYRLLLAVEDPRAREWYLREAAAQHWSSRQLERQITVLYYERLLASRKKAPVRKEARDRIADMEPEQFIRDPYVLEFLDLKDYPALRESATEQAIIDNLQAFLLELGKGFSLVARQKRTRFEDEDFYVDLVFYNYLARQIFAAKYVKVLPTERELTREIERQRRLIDARRWAGKERV